MSKKKKSLQTVAISYCFVVYSAPLKTALYCWAYFKQSYSLIHKEELVIPSIFFLKREKGREKERERNIDVREKQWLVASPVCPNQGRIHNPGMCPNQGSSGGPFWFVGWRPINNATPARAPRYVLFLYIIDLLLYVIFLMDGRRAE